MIRELGTFERALVIADQHAPFHLVIVARLADPPPPQVFRQALKALQNHHPFLSARLFREKGRTYLAKLLEPRLPFRSLPRWNNEHWIQAVEAELGARLDVSNGPLFRSTYLYDATHRRAEIILSLCHAIADLTSAGRLMHELLTVSDLFMEGHTVPAHELPPSPAVETRFPLAFRGLRLPLHKLGYAIRQTADEIAFHFRTRGKRVPPPPAGRQAGRGHILSVHLPKDETESISERVRVEGVTLSSALNAAMLVAVNRRLYAGKQVPMRTFTFADLRPHLTPPPGDEDLACYISMLRYTLTVEGGTSLWELARELRAKFDASLDSGEKFAAALTTESLMRTIIEEKSYRMGATALDYNEAVPIRSEYGKIKVIDFHSFVSAYDLGPELSAHAQVFDKKLGVDFTYLDADMSRDEAKAIAEEIKSLLHGAI